MRHHHRLGLMATVIALALVIFTWPNGRLAPRHLPLGVVAGAPAASPLPSGFELHRFANIKTARAAIEDRETYGAVAPGVTYIATAASPAVATTLRAAVPSNRVVDLAAGTRQDPRAATISGLPLPLTILGIFVGALAALTTRRLRDRLVTLLGGALLAGLLGALITKTWLEAVPGHWLALAGVIALAVAAVSSVIAGLATRLGPRGIGIGAVLMMLVGNAWSAASSAPELLPQPAQVIGQLFPAGATGELLRSAGWFGGAAATWHAVVLVVWASVGLALVAAPLHLPARVETSDRVPVGV